MVCPCFYCVLKKYFSIGFINGLSFRLSFCFNHANLALLLRNCKYIEMKLVRLSQIVW